MIDGLPDAVLHTLVTVCVLYSLIEFWRKRTISGFAFLLLCLGFVVSAMITVGTWAFVFGVI